MQIGRGVLLMRAFCVRVPSVGLARGVVFGVQPREDSRRLRGGRTHAAKEVRT
jgi:hypothetical protein